MKFSSWRLSIILVALSSCNSIPHNDCKSFREGTFKMYSKSDNSYIIIHREDSIQTETIMKTGNSVKWKVIWKNDCEYSLQFINTNYARKNEGEKVPTLTYEIIKTSDNYYIFKEEFHLFKEGFIDTLWISK